MNLITPQLSHSQAIIIKDIAQNQIKTLISVSANSGLLSDIPPEQKQSVISKLLRDFSKLIDSPNQLFNLHSHSQSIFRHELFTVSYGGSDARLQYNIDGYPTEDIKAIWRKITAAQEFNYSQLN